MAQKNFNQDYRSVLDGMVEGQTNKNYLVLKSMWKSTV